MPFVLVSQRRANSLQQQERFDAFVREFDAEPLHEALVSFVHYDLGYFALEQKTLQPLDNPFGTRLSPMS
jgi:hypothetical protein